MSFPQELRDFVDRETWTFAKTMPEWPHEYLVRERVDEKLFVELVEHIRAHGYEGGFYRRKIVYYDEDDLTYWTMGEPVEETEIIKARRCSAPLASPIPYSATSSSTASPAVKTSASPGINSAPSGTWMLESSRSASSIGW